MPVHPARKTICHLAHSQKISHPVKIKELMAMVFPNLVPAHPKLGKGLWLSKIVVIMPPSKLVADTGIIIAVKDNNRNFMTPNAFLKQFNS
jgi:hypothetical protein